MSAGTEPFPTTSIAPSMSSGARVATRSPRPTPYVVGVAPMRRRWSWCPGLAVPMTRRPRATASWVRAVPTPPAAPSTRSVAPAGRPRRSRLRAAVSTTTPRAAASSNVIRSGMRSNIPSTAWRANVLEPRPNTRSPGATPRTPSPTSSTTPAASSPGTAGNAFGIPWTRPARTFQSNAFTLAARTAMRTCPGRACGSGTSPRWRTSGSPHSVKRRACIGSPYGCGVSWVRGSRRWSGWGTGTTESPEIPSKSRGLAV